MSSSEKSKEYKEGEEAFNKKIEENPYKKGTNERLEWYHGWYNERTRQSLKNVFEKYGVEY